METEDPRQERGARREVVGEERTEGSRHVATGDEVEQCLEPLLIVSQSGPCHHQQKDEGGHEHTGPPRDLPGPFVRPSPEDVGQMSGHSHHQGTGRQGVQAANPVTERSTTYDVEDAVVGALGRGIVELGHVQAGDDDHQDEEGGHSPSMYFQWSVDFGTS